jgi:hypothetical protein
VSETTVDIDQVEREHLEEVREAAHWTYLAAVLGGGTLLMLLFIALLGGAD